MACLRLLAVAASLLLAAGAVVASAQAPTLEAQLADARRLYDALNYEAAAEALDRLIPAVEPQAGQDAAAARVLASAYELRARSRYSLGKVEDAKTDFRALLRLAPGYTLTGQVSPRVTALLEDIRKAVVGRIVLNLEPADAEVELDGRPFQAAAGPIALAVGPHTVTGKRAGFRTSTQPFTVEANATREVVVALERVSASLYVVTIPAGVDVKVNGTPRGKTETGPLSPQFNDWPAKLNLPADVFSRPLVIDDLTPGAHTLSFQKDCHTGTERRIEIDRPADFRIDPIRLDKAIGSVYVDASANGAVAYLDGEGRGTPPLSLDEVCEGNHVVEVRSPWGRYVERFTIRPGDKVTVQARLRPSVAVIGVSGLPEGYRGADLRLSAERALGGSRTVGLFAPPAERVQQVLETERLSAGWLAFDRWRRPIGGAAAITGEARLDLSDRIARALDAQGVAELTARPGGDRNQFLLTILAAGSAEPDVVEFTLENPASITAAVRQLDALPSFYRPSVGMTVVDVLDAGGAVIVSVDDKGAAARAGLTPGDVVVRAGGQAVADASAFAALLSQKKANEVLAVEARDRTGASKRAELAVTQAPRLVAMTDQSWLFNALVMSLRATLLSSSTDDQIVRLNLAVALMRTGNWAEAKAELSKIQLVAGPGVSNGTVRYLQGLCFEALGQPSEAERAWQAAATDSQSQLTDDGPLVKELAERKLAGLRR